MKGKSYYPLSFQKNYVLLPLDKTFQGSYSEHELSLKNRQSSQCPRQQ